MSTFAALKTQVQSNLNGRTDIPDHIYPLATSDVNGMRLRAMQATTTLSVSSEETALPADFLSIDNAYVDADPRIPLLPSDENMNAAAHRDSGHPRFYAIVDGALRVNPVPDGTYSVVMRYYAKLADFSADGDTNDVLTTYPSLYLYASLRHAAVWACDAEKVALYDGAWMREKARIAREDRQARFGKGLVMQAGNAP